MSEPVVIVTGGGGSGCGRAISQRFAKGGAAVVVADIDEAGGRKTAGLIEEAGGRAAFFCADVRSDSQVKALVSFAEETFVESMRSLTALLPQPGRESIRGPTFLKPTCLEASTRRGGGWKR